MVHTTKELDKISDDILKEMEAEMNRGTDPYLIFFYTVAAILGSPFGRVESSMRNSSEVLTGDKKMKSYPVQELLPRTMESLKDDPHIRDSINEQRQVMESDYVAA